MIATGFCCAIRGNRSEFRAAVDILTELVKRHPTNADWQGSLASSHYQMGEILKAQGDQPGALEEYQAELAARKALAAKDPADPGWLHDLEVSHNRVGGILERHDYLAGALVEFQAALTISEELVAKDSSKLFWEREDRSELLQQQPDRVDHEPHPRKPGGSSDR